MKRTYLILLSILSTCTAVVSQPTQTFSWGVKAGGPGNDKIAGIASLGDNFYIAGRFADRFTSGTQKAREAGGSGIYIVRLDDKGNTDWVQTLTGNDANDATRITATNENIWVGGIAEGTLKAEKNAFDGEGKSLFLSSWNDKGKIQALWRYPYQGFATLDVIATTDRGNILLGGMFQGKLNAEGFEQTSLNDKRAYLLMLSAEGKPLKSWMSDGKGSHRLVSVSTAADGNRYLLFSINGELGFAGIPAGELHRQMEDGLALVKTTPSGDAIWIRYIAGTSYLEGVKVLAMPSGDPLVCANYTSKVAIGDTVMGNNGYSATALWLFAADGKLTKSHTLTSPVGIRALDMLFARNGNILITGYFRQEYHSPQLNVKSKLSYGDLFLLQTDDKLEEVWHDEPAEDAFSLGKAFTLDRMGNIVLTGTFTGKLDLRGQRLESAGGDDILVAKYYNCLQKKATITGNTMLCDGGKTTLSVSGDYKTYLWNGQWGPQNLTVKQPGTYSVLAYDKTGCAAADTVEVKSIQNAGLGLPESITVGPNQPVLLSASAGFSLYRWSDGLTGQQREVVYTSQRDSLYLSLQALSNEGCDVKDSVKVKFVHTANKAEKANQPVSGKPGAISFKTWPNPVTDRLNWYISPKGNYFVSLSDGQGRAVYQQELEDYQPGSNQSIDMSKMASGFYLLTITSGPTTFIFKILKK